MSGASRETAARLATHDAAIRRLARSDAIALAEAPLKGAVQLLAGEATVSLPLAGVIDLDAEIARLKREAARIGKDIARIDAKLGNAEFMAKAPEEVVEEQRERLAEAAALKAKTAELLKRLGV